MAIKADDRLIVALDFHTMEDVKALVEKLGDSVSYYKVGMELFYSVGGEVVRCPSSSRWEIRNERQDAPAGSSVCRKDKCRRLLSHPDVHNKDSGPKPKP